MNTLTKTKPSIEPRFRTIDGLRIRFAESETNGTQTGDALLLCPWPESLYAYEPTWSHLSVHAKLISVDLPGFGHSEYRADVMSPRAMGEFIVQIADEFGLRQPHVVGPDIGTSAALFAAAFHPERFRSIVVGSGGAAVPLQLSRELKEWVEAPDMEPYHRTEGRDIVSAVMGSLELYVPSDTAREDYLSAYAGERFAESMAYVRAYPVELPVLRDLLPEISTPVQVIQGLKDPVVPQVNAEFLHKRLPNSKLDYINAGHFTWEDAANEYGMLVTEWWERNAEPRGL